MKLGEFNLKIKPKAISKCYNHVLTKKRMCHTRHELRTFGTEKRESSFLMKLGEFHLIIKPKAVSKCNNHVLTKKRMCHMRHELRTFATEKRESSFYNETW